MNRPHEEPEDAHEGYFASISDLMVGILFIFLLMLAVFAINYADEDKDKEIARLTKLNEELRTELNKKDAEIAALRGEVAAIRDDRDRLKAGVVALIKQIEDMRIGLGNEKGRIEGIRTDLLLSLKRAMDVLRVNVEVDAGQGILRLLSDGLFLLNEDKFTQKGLRDAGALINEIALQLPCFAAKSTNTVVCDKQQPIFETVLIEGHTDTSATNRTGGNWTLSTDRARAFLELMTGTISSVRDLRNSEDQLLLGLAGYGETRPRRDIPGDDERNRRIEVRFLLSGQRDESLAGEIQRVESLRSALRSLVEAKR